jgi:Helix-turn-helix of DDE superfamily endonuclease
LLHSYVDAKLTETETEFRRLSGVTRKTFRLMVEDVKHAETTKKKSGKPHHLSPENRVLLFLEYLRDYPTFLRLGVNWGVHESTAKRIQNRVEDILIQNPNFHVQGRKRLQADSTLEFVVVDASERPVERPKKRPKPVRCCCRVKKSTSVLQW